MLSSKDMGEAMQAKMEKEKPLLTRWLLSKNTTKQEVKKFFE